MYEEEDVGEFSRDLISHLSNYYSLWYNKGCRRESKVVLEGDRRDRLEIEQVQPL